jgi:nucleoside-diphosphate-sugar epimerase
MTPQPTILVLGGTGRTGRCVVAQLLSRGAHVRTIVRSAARLPAETAGHPGLQVTEADLLTLSDEALQRHVHGCQAVVSCLGHTVSLQGVYGSPRDLVAQAALRISRAAQALHSSPPLRLVLMSSVSVNAPNGDNGRRGGFERVVLWAMRGVLPPAGDNQRAADFLCRTVGPTHPHLEWAIVRPDTLIEGEISQYAVHHGLVASLFHPDDSTMSNVAHFLCERACEAGAWEEWKGRLPVIVNVPAGPTTHP